MTKWILFLLPVLFFSCESREIKANLCQSWRYDLSAIRREMSKQETDFAAISYMESIMGGLQHAQLRFSRDGKLAFQMDNLNQSGRWKLRKRGKELVLQMTDVEQVHQIVLLNADTLILEPISGEGPAFPRVLVRDTVSESVE